MLELVEASHFSSLSGTVCDLYLTDGSTLPVLVDCVTSKPQSRNPYAGDAQRMPFSVSLTAQQATAFVEGPCAMDLGTLGRVDGIYVSRVAALGRDPAVAYFQMVFN
ncbi:DUF6916 family protein [Paraherbaspirillum soli]|uniref:DUF6916 family protein n=1 Tax=Paraherbaspirillum soli TaxID=631222 RepID=A0ABW0MB36_9BURK